MATDFYKEVRIENDYKGLGMPLDDLLQLTILRSITHGFTLYVKSAPICDLFKRMANNKTTPAITEGWGVDMKQWDLNTILADQSFDQSAGGRSVDYNNPDEYIPANMRTVLTGWRLGNCAQLDESTTKRFMTDRLVHNPNYMWENTDGSLGTGIPNLSFLLSDKLGEGFRINLNLVSTNDHFDLYYKLCKKYIRWLTEITSDRASFLRIKNDDELTMEGGIKTKRDLRKEHKGGISGMTEDEVDGYLMDNVDSRPTDPTDVLGNIISEAEMLDRENQESED